MVTKGTPKMEKQSRKSFKEREMNRTQKYLDSLIHLNKVAEASEWKPNQVELIAESGKALTKLLEKLLSTLPDDFTAPSSTSSPTPEEGDEVQLREQYAPIYGAKKNEVFTVKEVARVGGSEDGRGSKIFLKLKRADGSFMAVQASHCE